jgi:hypothetical protein
VANLETGTCMAESRCGPGTKLDLGTGTCVPEAICGPGTVADADSGECLPEAQCGPGTTLNPETGSCEPDFPCDAGTTWDEASGTCVGDLECGPEQVVVEGQCVQPNAGIALEADATETLPDDNDPLTGGSPEDLSLEVIGSQTVAVGNIARPADLSGNGVLVQDRDVWRFSANGGTYLNVEVRSLGLPQPAFILEGPNGYQRTSAPSAYLLTGQPQGAVDAGYVVVLESLSLPTMTTVTPGEDASAPTTQSGDLRNSDANFYALDAAAGTAIIARFSEMDENVAAAGMAFTDNLTLLAHVQDLEEGQWTGFFVTQADDAFFFADWTTATGSGTAYTVEFFEASRVSRGDIPGDYNTVTASLDVPGDEAISFSFSIDAPQVIEANINSMFNPDVQVVGPGGTRALFNDDDDFFFYADAGDYVIIAHNDGTTDRTGVSTTLSLFTPHDLGELVTDGTAATAGGDRLTRGFGGFEEAWFVVRTEVPALLALDVAMASGDPDLFVHAIDGTLLRALHRPQLDRAVHVLNRDPRPVVIRLSPDGRNILDWSLQARALSLPPHLDIEPNDTRTSAIDLGAAPITLTGTLDRDALDVFTFELDAEPTPAQSIRVHFDNMRSDSVFGTISDGAYVRVFDSTYTPLPSIPDAEGDEGVLGANTLTFIPGYEGAGPYFIELFGDFLSAENEYVLDIQVADLGMEVEANNLAEDADPLGPLPAERVAYRGATDPVDLFSFTLDAPLLASESLVVEARNFENNNKITLTLESEAGDFLASTEAVLAALRVGGLVAGTYRVRVEGATGGEPVYHLAAYIGGPVEMEPNDSPTLAQDLGTLDVNQEVVLHGKIGSADVDVFTFSLPSPLGPDEGVEALVFNLGSARDLRVDLHGDATDSASTILSSDRSDFSTVLAAPQASTGPFTLRVTNPGNGDEPYRLVLKRSGATEIEPNDIQADATTIAGLPARYRGTIRDGDVDVFAFTHTENLGLLQSLVFRLENESDGTSITLQVLGEDFVNDYGGGTGFRITRPLFGADPETFYAVVSGGDTETGSSDVYTLDVYVE